MVAYILIMSEKSNKKWANVVIPHPLKKKFTYLVPEKFRNNLYLGHGVIIPFGSRKVTGVVVDFPPSCQIHKLREIEDILLSYPLLTPQLLKLTQWVSEYYLCSWGEVIRAALPPGIFRESQVVFQKCYNVCITEKSHKLSDSQRFILSLFRDNEKLTLKTLQGRSGKNNIRFTLAQLEQMGFLQVSSTFKNQKVSIQTEKVISLQREFDHSELEVIRKRSPKQADVLIKLMNNQGRLKRHQIQIQTQILKRLEMKGWIRIHNKEIIRDPYKQCLKSQDNLITLTREQRNTINQIGEEIGKNVFQVFLLYGVTGSGKTQVYIEAIKATLDQGKTAIILIPEISLTPQAVERYRNVFGNNVAVLHSRMSLGERYDSWRKMREGKFKIGLGPRSAVFAPLENIGCIVVDEEHETSYKQKDPNPRYHARDVAIIRGKFNDCVVILGSATPSMESYFNALNMKYKLCQLNHRIDQIPLPKITVIHRQEAENKKNNSVFSQQLQDKIFNRLNNQEQIILLQNRRGYSTFLRCRACGDIERCPHCDISLTYHQCDSLLKCHYCGYQKKPTDICKICGGATISYRGIGIQKVEEQINILFSEARLLRMDLDTTKRKHAHSEIIKKFETGGGQILLGTQMVAKGHDFPGVSLVGIISADVGLYLPDFRANEHSFQLLTQASGRAGRRKKQGEVIIQTHYPDHDLFQFVINHDFQGFYNWEINQRKSLDYPPWGRIILIRFQGSDENRVYQASRKFKTLIPKKSFIKCLGPVTAPIAKLRNLYRIHLIFRENRDNDPNGYKLRNLIREGIKQYNSEKKNFSVKMVVDVDPVDML